MRNLLLLAASYALYAWWDGWLLALVIASTVVAYGIGIAIERDHRKDTWTAVGIAYFIAVLALCKYADFFLDVLPVEAGAWLRSLKIVLPLGMSFYTFSAISYFVDIRRGIQKAERDPVVMALFIAFFPKMLAGPIERAGALLPQFHTPTHLTKQDLLDAAFLLAWGFVLKVVVADNAAAIIAHMYEPKFAAYVRISGLLALPLQIFADFAGYSMLAMGAALLVGIRLQWNFHFPYAARNPSEFWRNWHISLSEWFRDYVYIPLGGSRAGRMRTTLNLLITMTLVGLWHGPRWKYIAWGLYHGVLSALYHCVRDWKPAFTRTLWWRVIAVAACFTAVSAGWFVFLSPSLTEAAVTAYKILTTPFMDSLLPFTLMLWAPVLVMALLELRSGDPLVVPRGPLWMKLAFAVFAYYAIVLLSPSSAAPFIYVQF